jgi:hypothetical protein
MSHVDNVRPRRSARPRHTMSWPLAGSTNCIANDVVAPRSCSGSALPHQVAAIAAMLAEGGDRAAVHHVAGRRELGATQGRLPRVDADPDEANGASR